MALVEVMIAAAIVTIVTIGVAALMTNMNQSITNLNTRLLAMDLKVRMAQLLYSPDSWGNTRANDPAFSCLSDPITCTATNVPFHFYDNTGIKVFGWNRNGVGCPADDPFDPVSGNDNCPFGINAKWSPDCGAGAVPCAAPMIRVEAKIVLKAATSSLFPVALNSERYALSQLMTIAGAPLASLDPLQLKSMCNLFGGTWDLTTQRCTRLNVNGRCPAGSFVTGINPINSNVECSASNGASVPPQGIGCTGGGCVATDGGPCYGDGCLTNGSYCNGKGCVATGPGASCDGAGCIAN